MAIVAGDFTGDGHLDLAFTDQDYYVGGIQLTYSTFCAAGQWQRHLRAGGYGWLPE